MKLFKTVINVALVGATMSVFFLIFSPSEGSRDPFIIKEGESIKSISMRLYDARIIKSQIIFRLYISYFNKDKTIGSGEYHFTKALTLPGVVLKLTRTTPDKPLISITIPEGSTDDDIINIIMRTSATVSKVTLKEAITTRSASGKLFPETYFFVPSVTEEGILKKMINEYTIKLARVKKSATEKNSPVKEYLTKMKVLEVDEDTYMLVLSSIIQGEGKTRDDMAIISGILWKRLLLGMPLQVDVAKETYKKRGLPSFPINNPGLDALNAGYNPTSSLYLYYISEDDGTMHYAKTFEEHKKNIQKYLR